MDNYDKEFQTIWEDLLQKYIEVKPSETPQGFVLGGQPAAGKSQRLKAIRHFLHKNVLIINGDEFRRYHPKQADEFLVFSRTELLFDSNKVNSSDDLPSKVILEELNKEEFISDFSKNLDSGDNVMADIDNLNENTQNPPPAPVDKYQNIEAEFYKKIKLQNSQAITYSELLERIRTEQNLKDVSEAENNYKDNIEEEFNNYYDTTINKDHNNQSFIFLENSLFFNYNIPPQGTNSVQLIPPLDWLKENLQADLNEYLKDFHNQQNPSSNNLDFYVEVSEKVANVLGIEAKEVGEFIEVDKSLLTSGIQQEVEKQLDDRKMKDQLKTDLETILNEYNQDPTNNASKLEEYANALEKAAPNFGIDVNNNYNKQQLEDLATNTIGVDAQLLDKAGARNGISKILEDRQSNKIKDQFKKDLETILNDYKQEQDANKKQTILKDYVDKLETTSADLSKLGENVVPKDVGKHLGIDTKDIQQEAEKELENRENAKKTKTPQEVSQEIYRERYKQYIENLDPSIYGNDEKNKPISFSEDYAKGKIIEEETKNKGSLDDPANKIAFYQQLEKSIKDNFNKNFEDSLFPTQTTPTSTEDKYKVFASSLLVKEGDKYIYAELDWIKEALKVNIEKALEAYQKDQDPNKLQNSKDLENCNNALDRASYLFGFDNKELLIRELGIDKDKYENELKDIFANVEGTEKEEEFADKFKEWLDSYLNKEEEEEKNKPNPDLHSINNEGENEKKDENEIPVPPTEETKNLEVEDATYNPNHDIVTQETLKYFNRNNEWIPSDKNQGTGFTGNFLWNQTLWRGVDNVRGIQSRWENPQTGTNLTIYKNKIVFDYDNRGDAARAIVDIALDKGWDSIRLKGGNRVQKGRIYAEAIARGLEVKNWQPNKNEMMWIAPLIEKRREEFIREAQSLDNGKEKFTQLLEQRYRDIVAGETPPINNKEAEEAVKWMKGNTHSTSNQNQAPQNPQTPNNPQAEVAVKLAQDIQNQKQNEKQKEKLSEITSKGLEKMQNIFSDKLLMKADEKLEEIYKCAKEVFVAQNSILSTEKDMQNAQQKYEVIFDKLFGEDIKKAKDSLKKSGNDINKVNKEIADNYKKLHQSLNQNKLQIEQVIDNSIQKIKESIKQQTSNILDTADHSDKNRSNINIQDKGKGGKGD